jgi:hypothetical protein
MRITHCKYECEERDCQPQYFGVTSEYSKETVPHSSNSIPTTDYFESETQKENLLHFRLKLSIHLKNAVFWDVVQCRSSAKRPFGGTNRLHLQVGKSASEEPA